MCWKIINKKICPMEWQPKKVKKTTLGMHEHFLKLKFCVILCKVTPFLLNLWKCKQKYLLNQIFIKWLIFKHIKAIIRVESALEYVLCFVQFSTVSEKKLFQTFKLVSFVLMFGNLPRYRAGFVWKRNHGNSGFFWCWMNEWMNESFICIFS